MFPFLPFIILTSLFAGLGMASDESVRRRNRQAQKREDDQTDSDDESGTDFGGFQSPVYRYLQNRPKPWDEIERPLKMVDIDPVPQIKIPAIKLKPINFMTKSTFETNDDDEDDPACLWMNDDPTERREVSIIMSERDRILRQIANGRQMVVGNGGQTIRSADEPAESGTEAKIKAHKWGNG